MTYTKDQLSEWTARARELTERLLAENEWVSALAINEYNMKLSLLDYREDLVPKGPNFQPKALENSLFDLAKESKIVNSRKNILKVINGSN